MIHVNPDTGNANEDAVPPAGYTLTFSTPSQYEAWKAANGKGQVIDIPPSEPVVLPHSIWKDTVVQRIKSIGKLGALRQLVNGLDDDTRFEWDNYSWFSSDNPLLLAGCANIGCSAEETALILAPDPKFT